MEAENSFDEASFGKIFLSEIRAYCMTQRLRHYSMRANFPFLTTIEHSVAYGVQAGQRETPYCAGQIITGC